MTSGPPPAASKWQLFARFRAVKGEGFDRPKRVKTRRARGEQAEARWELALLGLVVSVGLGVAAGLGAVAVCVPPDEELQPASKTAAVRIVVASFSVTSV
jgi:hypothetical protein